MVTIDNSKFNLTKFGMKLTTDRRFAETTALKKSGYTSGATRWDINCEVVTTNADEVSYFNGIFIPNYLDTNSFELTLPAEANKTVPSTGRTYEVTNETSAGSNTMTINRFGGGTINSNDIVVGNYFNVGGSDRMYIINDIASGVMKFAPRLDKSVKTNTTSSFTIDFNNASALGGFSQLVFNVAGVKLFQVFGPHPRGVGTKWVNSSGVEQDQSAVPTVGSPFYLNNFSFIGVSGAGTNTQLAADFATILGPLFTANSVTGWTFTSSGTILTLSFDGQIGAVTRPTQDSPWDTTFTQPTSTVALVDFVTPKLKLVCTSTSLSEAYVVASDDYMSVPLKFEEDL